VKSYTFFGEVELKSYLISSLIKLHFIIYKAKNRYLLNKNFLKVREELLEAIKKIVSLVMVLVALSFLLNFVSSLDFSETGLSGFIGFANQEINPQEVIPPDIQKVEPYKNIPVSVSESSLANLHESFDPPQVPLFFVEGLNKYTNRLRLYTAIDYMDGKWIKEEAGYGDTISINPTGHVTAYRITPVQPFSTHIPVAKDTAYVTAPARFDRDTGTYFISNNLSEPYDAYSTAWKIEPGEVLEDEKYTRIELPDSDIERIKSLAQEITVNALTDYEKLVAIKEYLEDNYEYDPNYQPPPEDVEPVTYFLFENKKGICKEFASAFVLLARSLDMPARAVIGFNARPIADNQTVMASQAHMWAEVKFSNGWIEFDPTPPPENMLKTITEITYADPTARKGENFTVKGYVRTEDGLPVPDGFVEISIKENKNETGLLLGILKIDRGWFEGKVKVPDDVSGKYHVIAHYVGSLRYKESWSDPIIKIYSPPDLIVEIPDKMALGIPFKLQGRIVDYNDTPISYGDIILRVDGKVVERTKSDENGFFELNLRIDEEGLHTVSVEYPGSEFILPISRKKVVEVGRIELLISNKSAIKGKEWLSTGRVLFRGEPFSGAVIKFYRGEFSAEAVADSNGNFTVKGIIPQDFDLGKIPVNFTIKGVGFEDSVYLSVKAETEMDVSVKNEGGKTYIYVLLREKGRSTPAFGKIRIGDRVEETNPSGLAVFEYESMPSESTVIFEGNEKYLPSSKNFRASTFPFWALSAVLPVVAYILLTKYRRLTSKKILIEIEKEMDDLPLVWSINEEIRLRIRNLGDGTLRVFINNEKIGEHEKGLEVEVAFEEEGVNILRAERLVDGEVKEKEEVELKIMDYRKAIILVFSQLIKELEEMGSVDLSDYTAREILKMFRILNGSEKPAGRNLLRLFELSKYGMREAGRKEFVEAYRWYKDIRGDLIEK
jgi:transglutaminase-like putative cysteine protease